MISSVFGPTAFPGTGTLETDGTPSIETAADFYAFAGPNPSPGACTGGRVYMPAGEYEVPDLVTVRAYLATDRTTPLAEVTTAVEGPGAWTEVSFSDAIAWPEGTISISAEFSTPGAYLSYAGSRTGSSRVESADMDVAWTHVDLPGSPGTWYRIGGGAWAVNSNPANGYGIDILVSDVYEPPVEPEPTRRAVPIADVSEDTWTVSAGTVVSALADDDPDTYATSPDASGVLTLRLGRLLPPGDGQGAQVILDGIHYTGDATIGTVTVGLFEGSTMVAESDPIDLTAGPETMTVEFTAEQLAGLDWDDLTVAVTYSAS